MDAFYASVEQRDDPTLRGRPVVVGGRPNSRSVVAAASYEARKFGVHSAMPCSQAERLCPSAVFVKPRFSAYRAVSEEIMAIFRSYTEYVEPLSLDEAFLDVTENNFQNPSATWIAQEIREKIKATTQLTASAGVAPNKFLAKVASAMNKPDGITVISPDRVQEVLSKLPVRKVPGVGKVTEEKLKRFGIATTKDFLEFTEPRLIELFGKMGGYFFRISHGIDDRPVRSTRERKSVGAEDTFSTDSTDVEFLIEELRRLSAKVWDRLEGRKGRTITVKVTYHDFEKATRARTLPNMISSSEELHTTAIDLLRLTEAGTVPIRLVGVTVSQFDNESKMLQQAIGLPIQLQFDFQ